MADLREALEAACLEGLIETPHGWRYRPSKGADAVEAVLAVHPAQTVVTDEITDDMVERAASALWANQGSATHWDHVGDLHRDGIRTLARAALTAALTEEATE